jgi:hypothetical protein
MMPEIENSARSKEKLDAKIYDEDDPNEGTDRCK